MERISSETAFLSFLDSLARAFGVTLGSIMNSRKTQQVLDIGGGLGTHVEALNVYDPDVWQPLDREAEKVRWDALNGYTPVS